MPDDFSNLRHLSIFSLTRFSATFTIKNRISDNRNKTSMKKFLQLILFLLSISSIVSAQTTDSATTAAPADSKPATKSTKRPDLNNLINLTGQKAPDFVSVDMNGTEYNLENLRGKIVVINLWATWCVPCVEEMPMLNNMVNKFKGKDVVFLGATSEDSN